MNKRTLNDIAKDVLADEDYELESTAQSISAFERLISQVSLPTDANHMVDIGCGHGGLTRVVSEYFELPTVHGIDKDEKSLSEARMRGIITHNHDVRDGKIPIRDDSSSLVLCLGTLEHLPQVDTVLREIHRILHPNGVAIIVVPNLGSWVNRLSLLGGWQPRNVEVSHEEPIALAPWYGDNNEVLTHMQAPTYKALKETVKYHKFECINIEPLFPYQRNGVVRFIDVFTRIRPQLARRLGVVATPKK